MANIVPRLQLLLYTLAGERFIYEHAYRILFFAKRMPINIKILNILLSFSPNGISRSGRMTPWIKIAMPNTRKMALAVILIISISL